MAFKAITLLITGALDSKAIRENFTTISNYLNGDPLAKGQFRFIQIPVAAAGILNWKHGLNFQPTDVITLSVSKSSTATIQWMYDSFDREKIVLNASGPCTVRAYIGSYKE